MKKFIITGAAIIALVGLSACETYGTETPTQQEQVEKKASSTKAYIPQNTVELDNYNAAQKVYDAKDSIIWCTTTWGNASAPLVTIPIRGKLTSSSVSYFPNNSVKTYGSSGAKSPIHVENRSVDGMFHGSPPAYRYGFTPGGQYVDFDGMPTFCTTALTSFQRQSTDVTIKFDGGAQQNAAQDALKSGDPAAAEKALEGLETVK